jgi:HEAT repeat protein
MNTRIHWGPLLLVACLFVFLRSEAQEATSDPAVLIKQLETPGKGGPERQGRRDAALALSELGPEAAPAVPALINALEDGDTQVWFHSVTALARIGSAAKPAIPALLEDLKSGGRRGANAKWYRSAYALGNMGPTSLPQLTEALTNSHAGVRAGVAKALGWLAEEAAVALPDLIASLEDEDDDVRRYAAESIGKMGPLAIPALATTLHSPNHSARKAALTAVKTLGTKAQPLLNDLIKLTTENETPDLQAGALNTLTHLDIKPTALSEIVWSLADHTDEEVLHEVANGLLDLPPSLTVSRLVDRLGFEDLATQLWAADLLGRMGPEGIPAVPRLIELIESSRHDAHTRAFTNAIASLGPSATEPLFTHLTEVSEDEIDASHWIVKCLGNYGIPGLRRLSRGLSDDNDAIRLVSIHAIKHLGADGRDAVSKVERNLRDTNPRIRSASLLSLMAISSDPERYTEDVRRLLNDDSPEARQAAAKSVPHIGDTQEQTIQRLGELLQDDNSATRLASTEALASIGEKAASQSDRLATLLVEKNDMIKIAAVEAIGEIGKASSLAVSQIASLANLEAGDLRLAALQSLGQIGTPSPQIARVVRSAVSDNQESVREAALKAFGRVIEDIEEQLNVNLNALNDEIVEVQLAAAKNLGALGEDGIPATRFLMELLSDRSNFTTYLNVLKKIPADESQLEYYLEGLEHRSSGVRAYACETLGRLGEKAKPAVQKLERLAEKDQSRYVKSRAETALERITGEDRDD